MENKNQKKSFLKRLFSKKAAASVGAAVKVLTSVVLGVSMLAGTYGIVKTGVIPTAEAKVSSMYEVTDAIELNGGGAGGGVVVPDPVVELKRNGIIPTGATYTPNGGTALVGNGTNTFPDTPQTGDAYEEGDYIYKYNQYYYSGSWSSNSSQNGWGIRVKDTSKTSYGDILSEIARQPVNTMYYTFYKCTSLTTAPKIPNSVTDMTYTFMYCALLTATPTIPNSVTNMNSTFANCTSLTTAPVIPSSVTNMFQTFFGCTSLTTPPDMSNASSVANMERTFYRCGSLTTAPAIPSSVTNMFNTFNGCTQLTTASAIPSSVTNMNSTFANCTSLTTAPVIPSSVTNMFQTFKGCTSLTGTIKVNANPTSYANCLKSTQITSITGSCTQTTKNRLIATK